MNQLKENIESVDLLCSLTYITAFIGVNGKSSLQIVEFFQESF